MIAETEKAGTISKMKKWIIASRCFALPASVTPYTFGALLAVSAGQADFQFGIFILGLLGLIAIHISANMINDVADFKKGIDQEPNAGSGAVVRRILSPAAVNRAAALLMTIGIALGLYCALAVSINILYIGIAGMLAGLFYSVGPYPLKYHGWGDLAVFLTFGLLGALGGWTLQTAQLAWMPVVAATPVSIYIIAILHANNWRDISSDIKANIKTVAGMLGQWSLLYYKVLILSPYILMSALVLLDIFNISTIGLPPIYLSCWLSLPKAVALVKIANGCDNDPQRTHIRALDAQSAQLNLLFGLLCILSAIIDILWL